MNKNSQRILCVLCLIAMLFSFTSCEDESTGGGNTTDIVYHTVTFNTNGAAPIDPIQVQHNHLAKEPPTPQLDNHVFLRWEYTNGFTWFFDTKRVTSDLTLHAIWISAESLFSIEPVDGGLSITAIKRQEEFETLLVPTVINGKTIVAVSDEAFFEKINSSYAKNMVFPSTVSSVGEKSFCGISDVSVFFEGTIYSLGESAFERCSTLQGITLGNGMETIPFAAFASCTALKGIQIPDTVKVIEENAYEKCSSLLSVVLPASLTTIENSAFSECTALKAILYKGTEEQFDKIDIADENDAILNATVYFYSEEKPSTDGLFWHYDSDNSPVLW